MKVTSSVTNVQPEKLKVAFTFSKAQPKGAGPVSDSENEMSVEGSSGDYDSNVYQREEKTRSSDYGIT